MFWSLFHLTNSLTPKIGKIYHFFIVVIFVFDDVYHGEVNFSLWGLCPLVFE